ncbi:hypothetical protein D3C83_157800 [compost metagenome]
MRDDFAPLGARIRIADARSGEAALQARQMLVQPERHARIHRHQLVDAIAEDEAAIEHRHHGLADRDELSVQKNHACPAI